MKQQEQDKPAKPRLSAKEQIGRIRAVVPPVPKRFRKPSLKEQTEKALENVPRITNETIAEHREEVLKGARKYKYPLQDSKHKIVIVSGAILVLALIISMVVTVVSLYRLQSTSSFMYRVTQIVPFPIAKADDNFVSYESYLFELRRYMHYYQTQQQVDFSSKSGELQLADYKPRALQKVIDESYVKELAERHKISVSDSEVRDAVAMLRQQNRLNTDKELASVVKRFFDWSLDDLKRQLKSELLAEKVAATLDKQTATRANDVAANLKNGADFAAHARDLSDDAATKDNGGEYSDTAITYGSQDVAPIIVRELGRMRPGEVSGVIRTATSFEIVKLISVDEAGKFKAAHIQMNFRPVETFTEPLAKSGKVHRFVNIAAPSTAPETLPARPQ